ncbi:MAG: DUF1566 domain-containing protein [Pseudomonadota bacterium]
MRKILIVSMMLIIGSCELFEGGHKGRPSAATDASTSLCGNVTCTAGKTCHVIDGIAGCYALSTVCDPTCDLSTNECVDVDGVPTCIPTNVVITDDSKDITAFSINGVAGTITNLSISLTLPAGTSVTSLTPSIAHTGDSISPAVGIAKNFTYPVTYKVTAENGTFKSYVVTVTVTPQPTYAIRDIGPAGGLVFYDKGSYSSGWRYLEAAPTDQVSDSTKPWSNITTILVNATYADIGKGETNSTAIMAQPGHTSSAAKLCSELVVGTFSNWFLPSKEELDEMYSNLKASNVGGFTTFNYWSSTDGTDADNAWFQNFFNGNQYSGDKYGMANVRCARAF